MRFAANIDFLFTEQPWLHRFESVVAAGFDAVEFPWPAHDLAAVRRAVSNAGVDVVLVNAHADDLAAGHRGYANDPARIPAFRDAVDQALQFATDVACPQINLLVGNRVDRVGDAEQFATLERNLGWALERAEGSGVGFLIEVLNDRDTPRYLLTEIGVAADLIRSFATSSLRLQFDAYHLAVMEPDVVATYRSVAGIVGHVQLADAPGRHEPGSATSPLRMLLTTLLQHDYAGAVSLEYVPSGDTSSSLAWLPRRLRAGRVADLTGLALD